MGGSCWAFASSSVLGSYAKINDMTHDLIELSPQHLVSCVPNPLKCGGTGGCMGSIEPLAYTYASLFGIVTEDDYPYASGSGGNDDVCEFDATTTDAAVMTMGFETLPHSGCVDGGVESVEVCGTCAVVSDNSYPLGTTFMA